MALGQMRERHSEHIILLFDGLTALSLPLHVSVKYETTDFH